MSEDDPKARTIAAYDAFAADYAAGTAQIPELVRTEIEAFAAALDSAGRVLEIGSGSGRDARELEAAGLSVRRTDITPAFVELIRADGFAADVVDPLVDDLDDPERPGTPYDGVWSSACLLHVDRDDLPTVLARLAAVTRPGGRIHVSVKEGDGDRWSTHGHVTAARRFVYWRAEPLRAAFEEAGWRVDEIGSTIGKLGDPWLDVRGTRA